MEDNLIGKDSDPIIKETEEDIYIEKKVSKKKQINKATTTLIIVSLIFGLIGGLVGGFLSSELSNEGLRSFVKKLEKEDKGVAEKTSEIEKEVSEKGSTVSIMEEESAVIKAVEKASPAVVSVIVTKDVPKLDSFFIDPFANDPSFNPFGFKSVPQGEPETEKREIGGGTGFILNSDGYIVTNKHVVDDMEADYSVIMNDGERYDAVVLARDTLLDIAVMKVDAKNLPVIELGDSDKLKAGQTVIAIGNSLGEFRNTVSKGIISGLKRSINAGNGRGSSELLEEVIQTDAAINPGNSGGPIINLKGQVVGVNVAMAQGAENIGFSIPINDVKRIYQSVKVSGRIMRPYMGIRYANINKELQAKNKLDFDYGAVIVRGDRPGEFAVLPGSPADKAGLLENDIILEIDGERITKDNDLARVIKKKDIGMEIVLKVWSKGEEKIVRVMLEEAK